MTLVAAFLAVCRARLDDGPPDAEACDLVYQQLQTVARSVCRDRAMAQDAASRAFLKLLENGEPTFRREVDEPLARRYLRRMIEWHWNDILRRERRQIVIDDDLALPTTTRSSHDALEREEALRELEWARGYVFDAVVPELANRMRATYRDGFLHAIDQMRSLANEEKVFDDVVREECLEVTSGTRNRVYQQHCRARTRLFEWVEEELPSLGFTELRMKAIKALVAQLQLRSRSEARNASDVNGCQP